MKLEFVTQQRIAGFSKDELYSWIIRRVLDNRILIVERDFKPDERLEILTRGLLTANTETSTGINMIGIPIMSSGGKLRNRHKKIQFNLFAPGDSIIDQKEDGHYSVRSFSGNVMAEI